MLLFNFICIFYATVALSYPLNKVDDKVMVVFDNPTSRKQHINTAQLPLKLFQSLNYNPNRGSEQFSNSETGNNFKDYFSIVTIGSNKHAISTEGFNSKTLYTAEDSKSYPRISPSIMSTTASLRKNKYRAMLTGHFRKLSEFPDSSILHTAKTTSPPYETSTDEAFANAMNTVQIEDLLDLVKKKTMEKMYLSGDPMTNLITYSTLITYKPKSFLDYSTHFNRYKDNENAFKVNDILKDQQNIYDPKLEPKVRRCRNTDVCGHIQKIYHKVAHKLVKDFKDEVKQTADYFKSITGYHKGTTPKCEKETPNKESKKDDPKSKNPKGQKTKCVTKVEPIKHKMELNDKESKKLKTEHSVSCNKTNTKLANDNPIFPEGKNDDDARKMHLSQVTKLSKIHSVKQNKPDKYSTTIVNTTTNKKNADSEKKKKEKETTKKDIDTEKTTNSMDDNTKPDDDVNTDDIYITRMNENLMSHLKLFHVKSKKHYPKHRKNTMDFRTTPYNDNTALYNKIGDYGLVNDLQTANVIVNDDFAEQYKPIDARRVQPNLYAFDPSMDKRSILEIMTTKLDLKRNDMDELNFLTNSDDSWFKKHSYIFMKEAQHKKDLTTKAFIQTTTDSNSLESPYNIKGNYEYRNNKDISNNTNVIQPNNTDLFNQLWLGSTMKVASVSHNLLKKPTLAPTTPKMKGEKTTTEEKKEQPRLNLKTTTSHPESLLRRIFINTTKKKEKVQTAKNKPKEKNKTVIEDQKPASTDFKSIKFRLTGKEDIDTLEKHLINKAESILETGPLPGLIINTKVGKKSMQKKRERKKHLQSKKHSKIYKETTSTMVKIGDPSWDTYSFIKKRKERRKVKRKEK